MFWAVKTQREREQEEKGSTAGEQTTNYEIMKQVLKQSDRGFNRMQVSELIILY